MQWDIVVVSNNKSIVVNRPGRPIPTIKILLEYFKQIGLKTKVQLGVEHKVKARLVINHVDLTMTPTTYRDYFRGFPRGINTELVDISKSVVCERTLVKRDDTFRGPVIVKTNLNFGGLPERSLIKRRGGGAGKDKRRDFSNIRFLDPNNYPIFRDIADVPHEVWGNPYLVVQQLRVERDDSDRYCLRAWNVLGGRGFHVMTVSNHPIVKGSNILDRWVLDVATPSELLRARAQLGMDFGRIDYILNNGKAFIFDVNRTPTSSAGAVRRYHNQWRAMAMGIKDFLN